MAQSQFSLSWDAHKSNICTGLSALQQNGEFVDMTLAADGHHVKVHQVIIALASQYIKDMISSAQCPHPVVFLNKISYTTLSSILEYIYTGEVQIQVAKLAEFIQAGKELRIRGLEDMVHHIETTVVDRNHDYEEKNDVANDDSEMLEEYCFFSEYDDERYSITANSSQNRVVETQDLEAVETNENFDDTTFEEMQMEEHENTTETQDTVEDMKPTVVSVKRPRILKAESVEESVIESDTVSVLQYTVSTQGSLQMILNRFLYYLKHVTRDGHRHWRCVDYLTSSRCPALVITKNDMVVQRASAHIHTFHDKKILKKVRNGCVFTEILKAEKEGQNIIKAKATEKKTASIEVKSNVDLNAQ